MIQFLIPPPETPAEAAARWRGMAALLRARGAEHAAAGRRETAHLTELSARSADGFGRQVAARYDLPSEQHQVAHEQGEFFPPALGDGVR